MYIESGCFSQQKRCVVGRGGVWITVLIDVRESGSTYSGTMVKVWWQEHRGTMLTVALGNIHLQRQMLV